MRGVARDAVGGSQNDDESSAMHGEGEADGGAELVFSEFLEGIAAVACYKSPDPFIPIASRVGAFVKEIVATTKRIGIKK